MVVIFTKPPRPSKWRRFTCAKCRGFLAVAQHARLGTLEFSCAPCGWSKTGSRRKWREFLRDVPGQFAMKIDADGALVADVSE